MPTTRLEAFSDGVFAIAITLLIIEVRVPHAKAGQLGADLANQWPSYAAYVVSFVIIGIIWVNHHDIFGRIVTVDRTLLFLNLLLLLWTALLPFPTNMFAEYLRDDTIDAHVAAAVYSTNLTLAAIAFSLIWWHVLRSHLVDHNLTPSEQRASVLRYSIGTLFYAACIGLSFISAPLTLLVQFVLALYYGFEQLRTRSSAVA